MRSECWLIVLFSVGFVLPVIGLLHGYVGTKRRLSNLQQKYDRHRQLVREFDADHTAILAKGLSTLEKTKLTDALWARHTEARNEEHLHLFTVDATDTTGQEAQILITGELVRDLLWDLVLIGLGLAFATAAGIWAVGVNL